MNVAGFNYLTFNQKFIMQKIQFNSASQMWRFLETSKIVSYVADKNSGIATIYGATPEQLDRAKQEFQGKLI